MASLTSLKRLVALRSRQVTYAEAQLKEAQDQLRRQQDALMAAPPVQQLRGAQDFLAWQNVRDEGYRRMPHLEAAVAVCQKELSTAKLELKQIEMLRDKAAGQMEAKSRRKEAVMLDAWVASRHARRHA